MSQPIRLHCNLSPRGDENISGFTPIGSLLNCNLSPQGDGNLYRVILMYRLCIAIYPRKGTETDSHFSPHISSLLQFIPARGRETTGSAHSEFCIQLQFIPARGRKRLVLHCPLECAQIAIYPREGTKTFCILHVFTFPFFYCNLSPRGDENVALRVLL